MDFHIAQDVKIARSRWYEWSVWLEGSDLDLNKVSGVRYKLHETFPEPVRTITDRPSKFRLSSSGWGEFMIYADVLVQGGQEIPLRHWLRFGEPKSDSASLAAHAVGLTLFLSASAADEALADALQESLEKRGVKVLRPSDDSPLPLDIALQRLIEQVSMAVILVSVRHSPWLKAELKALEERQLNWIPVILGGDHNVPEALKHVEAVRRIQLKGGIPPEVIADVADNLAEEILHRCERLVSFKEQSRE
jgi:hypothetical protein